MSRDNTRRSPRRKGIGDQLEVSHRPFHAIVRHGDEIDTVAGLQSAPVDFLLADEQQDWKELIADYDRVRDAIEGGTRLSAPR